MSGPKKEAKANANHDNRVKSDLCPRAAQALHGFLILGTGLARKKSK
jgi:hypothetical protein